MTERYLIDKDIAELLGISLSRLRVKITYGEPLPDRIQAPGCRQRLWLKSSVYGWLEEHTVSSSTEKLKIHRVKKV